MKKYFFLILLNSGLLGCQNVSTLEVSASEIEMASNWSENDQPPTYATCEDSNSNMERACFESLVSESIVFYLASQMGISTAELTEEVILTIQINSEGYFSLLNAQIEDTLKNAIPQLENLLNDAVEQIPQAQPGVKTNVGTFVSTKFELPIRILARK